MATQGVRWRNVREFLDDLPKNHCHVKPPHEFCTVCMRINYIIAHDCPLFHQRPKRKFKPVREADMEEHHEPIKDHLTAADVKQALKGEEFPIIEFAGPRGGAPERDEEIFEVKPIEVKPIEEKAPKPKKPSKPKPGKTEEGEEKAVPRAKIDPDELMHRIMEEIDFPEEVDEEAEVEEGAEVQEGAEVLEEAEAAPEGTSEPEEGSGDEGERDVEEEPPRVEKKAVTKRRPKGKK
jgi:hypothetical protein